MTHIRRTFLALAFTVLATLAVALPASAATTTEESGPITKHEPQTYVYNYNPNADGRTNELYNKATGEHIEWGLDNGKCPILQPGDSLEIIPEPNVPNGNMAKGLSIVSSDGFPGVTSYESRGPLEVTSTETHAGYTFVTGIRNCSNYPVLVWSNSGGDRSAEEVSDTVSYTYRSSDLDFRWYPATVNVKYEFLSRGHYFTEDELATLGIAYYADEQNPTVFYAADALVNRYAESNETLGLDVYRPYLEGYRFNEYGGDQYRRGDSSTNDSYRDDLSKIYSWRHSSLDGTDRTAFYAQWAASSFDNQVINGSEDDSVYIIFRFDPERTITLDANGGTIDGYSSRIYEAGGSAIETQMDEDYAQGAYTPVREGYVFCGWYEDEACTVPLTSFHDLLRRVSWPVAGEYPLEERAMHVYAKWEPENPFIDVTENTGHYEDILWLARTGISAGWNTPAGKEFRPNASVARCDMAAFLFRLAKMWGLVDDDWQPSGSVSFKDVDADTPHYIEVMWLAESGVSAGWDVKGGKEFRPYANVARCDMAAFLFRLAKNRGTVSDSWQPSGQIGFKDVNAKTPHYLEVMWLAESKVSEGWPEKDGSKTFRPFNNVARADMAAFLHRLDGVK